MDNKYKDIGKLDDKVIEECAEVIHAICKAKRFGLDNWHPDTPNINNAKLICNEINDLLDSITTYIEWLKEKGLV